MLNKLAKSGSLRRRVVNLVASQARNYPGGKGDLKILATRKKSAQVIKKITNTMKLVASVRFKIAQQKAQETTSFFTATDKLFDFADIRTSSKEQPKILSILMTTDKGLCGPINSNLLRNMKKVPDVERMSIVLLGEKGSSGITNVGLGRNVELSFHYGGRGDPNIIEFGNVAEQVANLNYDICRIYYNKFVSAIEFAVTSIDLPAPSTLLEPKNQAKLNLYDVEEIPAEMFRDLHEFHILTALNYTYYQTAASEMASRQNSMDSATKNAGELIKKLRIRYNKIRQNVITTELIEITSGAQVIQGKKA
eukprot:TRINITY_DN5342_c0_g1_i2.p1 TRINITY_DN5342_c0_g1~~TRINITY_DN5342_c0_g1_i2.p1  ORF type:complete len:324 (-),score=66.47 TRINITY_DN5342_c0_g1_i2:79-1002(-)